MMRLRVVASIDQHLYPTAICILVLLSRAELNAAVPSDEWD